MTTSEIRDAIEDAIVARGCFIVDIFISKNNEIEITFESEEGTVDLDDCVAISRLFESKFDREVEDYELTVSSAGLDQPFKILKQYKKAIGTLVEVSLKGGRKILGSLVSADEDKIELHYTAREAVEGKKKKEIVEHTESFTFDQINTVIPYVTVE